MREEQLLKTGSRSAISKVPNEVLGLIFEELRRLCRSKDHSFHNITLVSHHWRDVALEDGSLWTTLPTYSHVGTVLMLKRSHHRPLDVSIDVSTMLPIVSTVLDNFARIEQLSVCKDAWKLHDFDARLTNAGGNAPRLRALEIQHSEGPDDDQIHLVRLSAGAHLASLRKLRIHEVHYDWNILPIAGLRSLRLVESMAFKSPTWEQVWDTLRQMPLLEDLSCDFALWSLDSAGPAALPVLNMLRLEQIVISGGSLAAINYFFSYTNLPALRDVFILSDFDGTNEDPGNYGPTVQTILSLLSPARSNLGRSELLEIHPEGFSMSAVPSGYSNARKGLQFMCQADLCIDIWDLMPVLIQHLSTQIRNQTPDISRLVVQTAISAQDIATLFTSLLRLTSLYVFAAHEEVIESLSTFQVECMESPAAELQDVMIGTSHSDERKLATLVRKWLRFVEWRQVSGMDIKKIQLTHNFTEIHAQGFRKLVDDVRFCYSL